MRRTFRYFVWWRVAGAGIIILAGLWLTGEVLYHMLGGVPMMVGNEVSNSVDPATKTDFIILGCSGTLILVTGLISLLVAIRAEVVVDPWGITAFGIGMNPRFRCAWNEITEIRMVLDETSVLQIRAGRRSTRISANVPNFSELRAIIEASVPPHVPRS
jgi:hypothetical protein